jgi:hypothetical protein
MLVRDVDGGGATKDTSARGGYSTFGEGGNTSAAAGTPTRRDFAAFDFARLLAAVHIVHFHMDRDLSAWSFHPFGQTWVGFFFLLSGFLLTQGRLLSARPTAPVPALRFVWRRMGSVYPLYAALCFLTAGVLWPLSHTVRALQGRLSGLRVPERFPYENQLCTGLLYGRAGRLTALFGGFRPGQRLPGFAAPWEFGPGPLCDYWGSTVFGDGVLSVLPASRGPTSCCRRC